MNKTVRSKVIENVKNGNNQFFIGKYFYDTFTFGIRRREQRIGRLPTSDWENVMTLDELFAAIK